MTDGRVNLRAAALTMIAVTLFAVSDTIIKLLTASYPAGQILFCRGVLASLLLSAVVLWRGGGRFRLPWRDPFVWARSVLEFAVSLSYFVALARLPLAEATAVLFVFPVLLTALAALVLKERVGWRRWCAVAAGLLGVVVIVRPGGAGFDPAILWALAAACGIAGRDLVTRFVHPGTGTETIALSTILFTTMASLATVAEGWHAVDLAGVAGFAGSAFLASIAFLCLVAGTRIGDVSFSAPFRYVTVPLSFGLGYLVWGDVPDTAVIAGSLIVVGSGLFVLYRERRRPPGPVTGVLAEAPLGERPAG